MPCMYSTINSIFHVSYFGPYYPTSASTVTGLASVQWKLCIHCDSVTHLEATHCLQHWPFLSALPVSEGGWAAAASYLPRNGVLLAPPPTHTHTVSITEIFLLSSSVHEHASSRDVYESTVFNIKNCMACIRTKKESNVLRAHCQNNRMNAV
jgi:hypothetical protein